MRKKVSLCLIMLTAVLLSACGSKTSELHINSLSDIKDSHIRLGRNQSLDLSERMPEVCPNAEEIMLDDQNIIMAFDANQVDACVTVEDIAKYIVEASNGKLKLIDEPFQVFEVAFAVSDKSNIPNLEEKVNAFVKEGKESGFFDEVYARWKSEGYNEEMGEVPVVTNPEYKLVVGTVGVNKPISYYKNNQLTGADIEIVKHLAAYLNAEPVFQDSDYPGILTGITTGKYDILAASLFISEERAKTIIFSDPYCELGVRMIVKNDSSNIGNTGEFLTTMKRGFKKTFIDEDRYLMILSGIKVTIIITIFGYLLAIIVGCLFCAMAMSKYRILRLIANAYSKIMQGTPIVVILMIIYYIIFASSGMSNIIVAIISFGLVTAASISQIYTSAIKQVNAGEIEAAMSLGFNKLGAFMGITLPQAIRNMLPAMGSQLVGLMKGTSIVGYIAVMDMTKVSDVIRSSTFEAIFPLLSIAFVYFLISTVILLIFDALVHHMDPANKKREIKGV